MTKIQIKSVRKKTAQEQDDRTDAVVPYFLQFACGILKPTCRQQTSMRVKRS